MLSRQWKNILYTPLLLEHNFKSKHILRKPLNVTFAVPDPEEVRDYIVLNLLALTIVYNVIYWKIYFLYECRFLLDIIWNKKLNLYNIMFTLLMKVSSPNTYTRPKEYLLLIQFVSLGLLLMFNK